MAEKLTREQLKGLTAEEKIVYQKRLNAARVAAFREAKAVEYNGTCKKIILIDQRTERNIKN